MSATPSSVQEDPAGAPPVPADFAALYEAHFDFVWANARRLGVPPASIDDAVQDVFLAVHRRLPEYRGEASLKTWLFHFVLRVAATHRRAAAAQERKQAPERAAPSGEVLPPDEAVEGKRATQLLYRLLGELSEARRELFVLVEIEEVSIAEAAALLGLNVNTAHSRLREARSHFEQAVARERAREDWRTR